jgi:hypothetical protein
VRFSTYCASRWRDNAIVIILSALVLTLTGNIAGDGDGEIKLSVWVGWSIGENGEEGTESGLSNTHVYRSPITHVRTSGSPLASIRDRSSSSVDVILSRGSGSLPFVVFRCKRIGERIRVAALAI